MLHFIQSYTCFVPCSTDFQIINPFVNISLKNVHAHESIQASAKTTCKESYHK